MSNNTGVVNIRGKEYMTVALRVQKFREAHPEWELSTEIIKADEKVVIMQARIYTENGKCIATGHAEEFRASSQINSTSALENCETSAIGRCLASAGWGGAEFASANEVQNAIHQQKNNSAEFVKLIEGSKNVTDLQSNWKAAYQASQSDAGFIAAITVAKDRRKAELSAA
jgi:hypothetical protein